MLTRRHLLHLVAAAAVMPAGAAFADEQIKMGDLYASADTTDYSAQAKLFNGTPVALDGFMAPPLKADARFFVLGTEPMLVCPFCDAAAKWPNNIVLVYPKNGLHIVDYDQLITVTGMLDVGVDTDKDTGFVSKVRLLDAGVRSHPQVTVGF